MNNAVIYARFSSDRQRSESIEQQVKVCTDFCSRSNLSVVATYADHAITGKTEDRPQFQQMIADAKTRTFDVVVVYALDRFSRSVYDSCVYEDILQKNNVRLLSATEPLTDDPSGILIKQIFRGFAEYYSAELSAKIRRGYADNASKFLAPGSVPFGFNRSADGHYIVNDAEAAVIREIFDRVAASEPFVSIYSSLNERGLKTKTGGLWNKSTISRLLSNKRYIGTFIWKDTETEDAIPAIIDKELFWKVQELIKTKPKGQHAGRRTPNGEYHLTGRLFCANCGRNMVGISGTRRDGALDFYYCCQGKRDHNGCEKKNVRRDYIEKRIADAMREICFDDDCVRWMAEQTIERQKQSHTGSDLELLKKRLKNAIETKANATKAVLAGIITDELKETIMTADAEQHSLEAQIKELEQVQDEELTEEEIIYFLKTFRTADTDNHALRNGLIDAFVTRIELSDSEIKVHFTIKKEDRQTVLPVDDLDNIGGSYKTAMWTCCNTIRTEPDGFCLIIAA